MVSFPDMPLGDCDCDVCELDRRSMDAREKQQPAPSLHVIPDVRHMPIEDRREVFLDGLRALTQMTGMVAKPGTFRSPAEFPGVMLLQDASDNPGDYAMGDDGVLTWKAR